MTEISPDELRMSSPRTWKYIVGAMITFPVFFLLWVVFDLSVLRPELAYLGMETTMDKLRWFGIPLLVIIILFGGKWLFDVNAAQGRERMWQRKVQKLKQEEFINKESEQSRREYVLEVLGLGITVEQYRQGKLWNILQRGGPYTSIREPDPGKYPWTGIDKMGQTGGRACDALENGVDPSPMFWGVPSLYAGGPYDNPKDPPSDISPIAGLAASAEGTGMAWHLFSIGPWQLSERPDQLLEQAFAFFDAYPDLPYLVLLSTESDSDRDDGQGPDRESRVRIGHYIPAYSDSTAVFILARRERVEPLRPYVWEDPDNNYLQETLRQMYYQLMSTVPMRPELKAE